MELTGKLCDLVLDLSGKAKLSIYVNEKQAAMDMFDELNKEEVIDISLGKHKKKRSLDANAYFWALCGDLAGKMKISKTDVYRQLIREIGDNYEVLPIKNKAVEGFIKIWQGRGLGFICDIIGPSKFDGYTNVCAYYGSSTYDTRQMAALIDAAIQECRQQGIPVKEDEEIDRMKNEWKGGT